MDRRDVIKRMLYPKCKSAVEFKFDTLMANPLLTYITVQDIAQLNKIATSIKYSSRPKEKYKMIDQILVPRGFKKMASGTNRVVYRFLDDYRIVLKVAIDKVGLSDNGNEFKNQQLLKPFVTKCFEVSPCGTVGLFERVNPITSREEFVNISEDVFDLINNLIGKYVLEDIGEKFYMNYGLREGFGPVLLDYPYVFELDGRKLKCNVQDPLDPKGYCGGMIDYDIGYNNLICTKCGKRYLATELRTNKKSDGGPKIIIEGEDTIMKCVLKRGDQVVSTLNSEEPVATNVIPSRQQYDRLRGHLQKRRNTTERENYKPGFNNHDDVRLQARLKGRKKSKDIDEIARDKEQKLRENTKSIPVSFDNQRKSDNLDVRITSKNSYNLDTGKSVNNKDNITSVINTTEVIIDDNGFIYDNHHNLIGYTRENTFIKNLKRKAKVLNQIKTKELENASNKEDETVTKVITAVENAISETCSKDESIINIKDDSESCATPLADKIKTAYVGNENYKTSGVTSPIDKQFHNVDAANDNKNSDKENEIPIVIINEKNKSHSSDKSIINNF